MFKFSIIICSFNGSNRITKTIEYLSELLVNNYFQFNVIIVDNNSLDNTFMIANQLKIRFADSLDIIVIQEFTQGKVFAIDSALNYSISDWIVICDDDNWLRNDYLLVAYSLIQNFKDVGIFGGMSNLPVNENLIIPEWFKTNSLKYAVGKQYLNNGYISYKENLWGAGSILNRNGLVEALKTVPTLAKNERWEDSEIGYRFIILGYKLYFSEALFFEHNIDIDRLNVNTHNELMLNYKNNRDSLKKYSHFLKYFYFNKRRFFSILKWNIIYILSLFQLLSLVKFEKYKIMINLFTNFGNDEDFKLIKFFYKINKYNRK